MDLNGRTQVSDVEGTVSDTLNIPCGVPQGSVLDPLLFLVDISDLPAAVKWKRPLYADDSALRVSGSGARELEDTDGKEVVGERVAY